MRFCVVCKPYTEMEIKVNYIKKQSRFCAEQSETLFFTKKFKKIK